MQMSPKFQMRYEFVSRNVSKTVDVPKMLTDSHLYGYTHRVTVLVTFFIKLRICKDPKITLHGTKFLFILTGNVVLACIDNL
jgi:hypothetical protein